MTTTYQNSPLLEKVFVDGVLLDVDVSFWGATRRNKADDLGITAGEVPEHVIGLGTQRVQGISHEEVRTWQVIAERAWAAVRDHAFPFPVASGAFVPLKALPEIEEKLGALKTEFERAVTDFMDLHPEYTDRRNRFSFSWSVFRVSLPESVERTAEARRYNEEMETRVSQFVDSSVGLLRQKVVEACNHLSTKLKSGDVIRETSLEKVRKVIDHFKLLNFAGDQTVEQALDTLKLEALNGHSAAEIRTDEQARAQLAHSLDAVVSTAKEITDRNAVSGEYKRRVRIGVDNG